MATVKLDILSDPICPWCYIGKTHLDKALAAKCCVCQQSLDPLQIDAAIEIFPWGNDGYLEKDNCIAGDKPGAIARSLSRA